MRALRNLLLALCAWLPQAAAQDSPMAFLEREVARRPGQSAVYVLETGEEALLTRAWLADHARESIDVQYFIWSTDNIGILAAAALLRAAERGVRVRVIVDALLIDAPPIRWSRWRATRASTSASTTRRLPSASALPRAPSTWRPTSAASTSACTTRW